MPTPFRSIVVVGAGSVGSFYGAMLARAGFNVTLIGRPAHVQAIAEHGLRLHMADALHTIPVAATTELDAVRGADLVLFSVKSPDTESVAMQIAPLLDADALVLSLQNGVENVEIMRRHLKQQVVPTAVYVATALPAPGEVRHFGRGELIIGPADTAAAEDAALQRRLSDVVALFGEAGIGVTISPDVMRSLWSKLLVNCAYNAISALAQMPYGRMAALPSVQAVQRAIVAEVVAVARADGYDIAFDEAMSTVERLAQAMPGQLSSTAQDVARRRPTEIDQLNGVIVRRGAALGIAVPVNQTLHALVHALQTEYLSDASTAA